MQSRITRLDAHLDRLCEGATSGDCRRWAPVRMASLGMAGPGSAPLPCDHDGTPGGLLPFTEARRMTGRAWWRRSLKALHQISAIGGGDGLAACLVIGLTANTASPAEFAAVRQAIAAIARYVPVPSLAVVRVTGMLAIAATRAYHDAGWAWVKALLGLSVFEAT